MNKHPQTDQHIDECFDCIQAREEAFMNRLAAGLGDAVPTEGKSIAQQDREAYEADISRSWEAW